MCTDGLGKKTESRSFNRATQSTRQTGSSSKPLAILVPGIKKRKFTAATIYDDTERDFKNGYHPTDYSQALGKITVRRAVESSQNIPFVEMMEEIKPSTSIKYLKKMGITTLTKEDDNLPLALGGLKKGISPLEMAGAYATIANDGIYIEPTFYTKAEKKGGKIAVKTKQKKRFVCSQQTSYIIKDILKQPVEGTNGTARYCKISGVDVAAKTGSTNENYDRWLCGFTPYYTAATWFGYDINESVEFNKRNPAGLIWANVMTKIHSGLKSAQFEKPGFVSTVLICKDTGMIARSECKNTYKENFLWLTTPELCNEHGGSERKASGDDRKIDLNAIIPDITKEIDSEEPQRNSTPKPEPEQTPEVTLEPTPKVEKQNVTKTNTSSNTSKNTTTTNTSKKNTTTQNTSSSNTSANTSNTSTQNQTTSETSTTQPSQSEEEGEQQDDE